MLILLIMILLIFMMVNLWMIISNIIAKKTFKDSEKKSSFECGIDTKNSGRLPFSLQFFLIAIMCLIFDVEITLLLPLISIIKISNFMFFNYMYMFLIFILLMELYHEWNQGALNWELQDNS